MIFMSDEERLLDSCGVWLCNVMVTCPECNLAFNPKTAGIGSSDPATPSAGEAVIENRWLDGDARKKPPGNCKIFLYARSLDWLTRAYFRTWCSVFPWAIMAWPHANIAEYWFGRKLKTVAKQVRRCHWDLIILPSFAITYHQKHTPEQSDVLQCCH